MCIERSIMEIREKYNISQEKFADSIGVSRQAVQKWESGNSRPDVENLVAISKRYNISMDYLLFGKTSRDNEISGNSGNVSISYDTLPLWESYSANLMQEYRQLEEEGCAVAEYENLFRSVSLLQPGDNKERMASVLFDISRALPTREDYPYNEPSKLESIRILTERTFDPSHLRHPSAANLRDRYKGAWYGRIVGCLLGKPLEGIRTPELNRFLKASGNYPLHRYLRSDDLTPKTLENVNFHINKQWCADCIDGAPADDDTNYTALATFMLDRCGRRFTSRDVADSWVSSMPKTAFCTAERVAYCNYSNGYLPPYSALYRNPYREWIGAQIRADYYGYICPCRPTEAADMAWRDASVSHVKNGIYGAMYIAALLACIAGTSKIESAIEGGLSEIPKTSRLYEKLRRTVNDFKSGVTEEAFFASVHAEYDEFQEHDWCHTIPNAMIVTGALLYGGGDFSRSLCMAVGAGFDTDCNGATVGSVLGMRDGFSAIGEEWTAPLNGKLGVQLSGCDAIAIDYFIDKTVQHQA